MCVCVLLILASDNSGAVSVVGVAVWVAGAV